MMRTTRIVEYTVSIPEGELLEWLELEGGEIVEVTLSGDYGARQTYGVKFVIRRGEEG